MKTIEIPRRRADIFLYSFFLLLSLIAYSVTGNFPSPLLAGYPGSAMFPRLVLIVMGIICTFGLIRVLMTPARAQDAPLPLEIGGYLLTIASLIGFALMLTFIGAEVAVFVFIAGGIYLRTRRALVAVGTGIVAVVVVYVLFVQALSVHLPLTFLPRYLQMGF
jgi:hypothetical protein